MLDKLKFWKSTDSVQTKDNTFEELTAFALHRMMGSGDSGSQSSGYVSGAMDILGKQFAKAKFRVYEKVAKGNIKELPKHAFLNFLNNPADELTLWEVLYSLGFNWGLNGVQYLYKLRNPFGIAIQYQILLSSRVRISKEGGAIKYDYIFDDGQVKPLRREDLIVLRYPHAGSQYQPKAIISNFASQVEIEEMQNLYQRQFLSEGGFLGAVFTTPNELERGTFDRAKAELVNNYSGKANNFKTALFDGGLQPVKAAYSPKDLDLKTQKEFTRDEILSAFQVPKLLLGVGDSINRDTAEAVFYVFLNSTIDPLLSFVDAVLTKEIQREYNDLNLYVEHDILAPQDLDKVVKRQESMLKNGFMVINEARIENGYEALNYELCNVPLINVGGKLLRLDKSLEEQQQEPKASNDASADSNNNDNNDDNNQGDSNATN